MKIFTIENETHGITLHATVEAAEAVANAQRFRNEAGLAKLAADWPAPRLIGIWNGLPGATPVRKFKDRATAVSRIWKEIKHLGKAVPEETLRQPGFVPVINTELVAVEAELKPEFAPTPPVAPHKPDVATEQAPAKTRASRAKKPPPVVATKKRVREGSKTQTILGLLTRPGGASLNEIMKVTEWQAHSVRGFVSGTLRKKMGLTVLSLQTGDGERSYSVEA